VGITYLPSVTISAHPGFYIAAGTYDTLVATVTGGGPSPSYEWFVNLTPIAGATGAIYISNAFANGDSVCCKVTGTGTCGLMSFNCAIMHVSTAVETVSASANMALFPNPNTGQFTLKGDVGRNTAVIIEVRNMIGQLLLSETYMPVKGLVNKQFAMDGDLPNGPYLLSVTSAEGQSIFHSGFIVRR
jgi:hypothetical protein